MKPILLVFFLALAIMGCRDKGVSPSRYLKPLSLFVEPRPNGLSLSWGPVFTFEEGMYPGPTPVPPAQYEVYISETGSKDGLRKLITLDGAVQQYTVTNQPPGKTLYVQVKATHPELAGSESSIVTTNVGRLGETSRLLPNNTLEVYYGAWSTTGTLIYTEQNDKWVIQSVDGSTRSLKAPGYNPVLSPDGRYIAYTGTRNNNTSNATQLFVQTVESGEVQLLDTQQAIFAVEWSNDGKKLAYTARSSLQPTGVWTYQLAEHKRMVLYTPPAGTKQLRDERVDWLPDDSGVLVVREGNISGYSVGADFVKIPASGGDPEKLFSSDWYDNGPAYSPDGTQLAFISTRSGYPALWVLTTATGKLRQLTGVAENFLYLNRLDWKTNKEVTYSARSQSNTYLSLRVVTLPN